MISTKGLLSTAAVQSQMRSYVFGSAANGKLYYLVSQTESEVSPDGFANAPPYEHFLITVNDRDVVVNAICPTIAAVSYTFQGHNEVIARSSRRWKNVTSFANRPIKICVYYISEEWTLQEVCRTDGGAWKRGKMSDKNEKVSASSLLTASVDFIRGQVKVYYSRENQSKIRCAWMVGSDKSWYSRYIT